MPNEEDANPLAAVLRLYDDLGELIDDPESAGAPVDFLVKLDNLSTELAENAQRATPADFEAEYPEESEGDDEVDAIDADLVG